MVKIVKEVKVPMDEIVKYLVDKGYLADEFEFSNIEQVEVKNRFEDEGLNNSGSKLIRHVRGDLNFRVNADLNLNNYIKKNEVDKYIKSKEVKPTEYTSSGEDEDVKRKELTTSFGTFFEILQAVIKDSESNNKGGN